MAEGPLLRRNDCLDAASQIITRLSGMLEKYEICGSLRRKNPMSHDLDIVVLPKPEALEVPNVFMVEPVSPWRKTILAMVNESEEKAKAAGKYDPKKFKRGEVIVGFMQGDVPVDLYVATPETYEGLVLIRTGSASHNTMLAGLAQSRKLQLHADGRGVQDTTTGAFVARTEREILQVLLGRYKEPEQRV